VTGRCSRIRRPRRCVARTAAERVDAVAVLVGPDLGRVAKAAATNRVMLRRAGGRATLRLHDARAAAEEPMPASVDWVRSAAVASEGTVVAGCEDGGLRLWQPLTTQIVDLSEGANTVWSAVFADGLRLPIFGLGDGTIEIRDADSAKLLRMLSAGRGRVWSLHAGAGLVAAACGDGAVRVWSLSDADPLFCLNETERRTWCVAIDPGGRRIAASAAAGFVRVWELPTGRSVWEQQAHAGRIRSMSFDDAGAVLLTGGGDGTARLWDATNGTVLRELHDLGGWVRAVALDSSGSRAAVGSGPGHVAVFDVTTGTLTARLYGHRGRGLALGLPEFPDRLVSAAADGTVRSWSISEQRQLAEVRVDASLQCAAFDADRCRVLTGGANGVVAVNAGFQHLPDEGA